MLTIADILNSAAQLAQLIGGVLALGGVLMERARDVYGHEVSTQLSFWGDSSAVFVGGLLVARRRTREKWLVYLGASSLVLGTGVQATLALFAPYIPAFGRSWLIGG